MDEYTTTLRFIRDVITTLTVSAAHPDFFATAVNIDNSLRLIDALIASADTGGPPPTGADG